MISESCWSWLHNCQSQLCLTRSSCDRDSVPDMCRYLRVSPPANIHGPFRAKGGKLRSPKNGGNDKFAKLSHYHPAATSCFASSKVARLPLCIAAMAMHNAIEWL